MLNLTSLLGWSVAVTHPSPSLFPRAIDCANQTPTTILTIARGSPAQFNLPTTPKTTLVYNDAATKTKIDTLLEFSHIPAGAWGCQLELYFARGYYNAFAQNIEPTRLNVFMVDEPISAMHAENGGVSWTNAPKATWAFGSVPVVEELATGRVVSEARRIVVDSVSCHPRMTFRVSVPEEYATGGVGFVNEETPFGGWRMTHNC
jgi:hypothetical protein